MRRGLTVWVVLAFAIGCSDEDQSRGDSTMGGAGQSGASGSANAGGQAGGAAGSGGGASGGGEPIPLPPGSREVGGVVNLVDAEAAQELETFLTVEEPVFVTLRQDLAFSFNLFIDHYIEDYDFVFFYTDHWLENANAAGIHQAVNRRAEPGGTDEIEIALGGYKTNGRTKAVLAMNYDVGFYGPLAHEMVHYWANYLDPRFGFGVGLEQDFGAHWGFASVNGQLGGFDGSTLRCETPEGSVPPCTALPSGRTRYVVGDFAPSANAYRSVPFSPLELYLAGLLPASEVPASFQLLTEAQIINPEATGTGGDLVVEAAGLDSVTLAEIQARHGQKAMLPDADRAFRAAFVVITATPASDDVMNDVARIAAVFGNRETFSGWESFEANAIGRATLDTRLGPRRDTTTPPPAARELFQCDVLAQDCGRPELGCYVRPPSFCALTGNIALDQPCDAPYACAPGFDCVASAAAPTNFMCKPYCDVTNTGAANSCALLCPATYAEFRSGDGEVLGGLCFPE